MDRVQVLKRESASLGGQGSQDVDYPTPIDPQEDAVEAAGLFVQDASNRDQTTLISRSGNNMLFKDGNNPSGYTLSDLASGGGGGISESQHEALDTLTHGIAESSYDEVERNGQGKVVRFTTWATSAMVTKVRELLVTYTNRRASQVVTTQHDASGAVARTLTEAITRDISGRVTSITRSVT